jgi:RND family efflux transporter MFP subunit
MDRWSLTGLSLALFFTAGCSKKNEFQPPPPPEVGTAVPLQQDVTIYDAYPGRLSARDSVDIQARVSGLLQSIEFTDGQRVKKGDLLFVIEPNAYEAAVQAAEADLSQAEASLKLAEATLARNQRAFKTKAVSELDLLSAEAQRDGAAGSVLEAQAALETAQLNLSYTRILAPMDGRMAAGTMSVGNVVNVNTLLGRLVVEAPVNVEFNVAERTLLPYLREGVRDSAPGKKMPAVRLELADGTVHDEEGLVDYIDPEIDPETGTVKLRAVFPNAAVKLLPGLYGKILIPSTAEDALLVPDLAVQRDMGGPFVLIVTPGDTVEQRYVETGALADEMRIVTEGLEPSDRVVVKGLQRARPGIQVRTADVNLSAE